MFELEDEMVHSYNIQMASNCSLKKPVYMAMEAIWVHLKLQNDTTPQHQLKEEGKGYVTICVQEQQIRRLMTSVDHVNNGHVMTTPQRKI